MAVPTDDEIWEWLRDFGGADTNKPAGTDIIGANLDAQFRVIKHVVRNESLNKRWEKWRGQYGTLTYVSASQFTLSGDQRTSAGGPVEVNRRIKATVTGGTVYGYVSAVSFAASTTTVTVSPASLDSGLSEVQFGTELDAGGLGTHGPALPVTLMSSNDVVPKLFASTSGTNTYTATLAPAPLGYIQGALYVAKFGAANTGAATLNLNGLGAIPLTKNFNAALQGGEILNGSIHVLLYDGTRFQIVSHLPDVPELANQTAAGTFLTVTTSETLIPNSAIVVAVSGLYQITHSCHGQLGTGGGNAIQVRLFKNGGAVRTVWQLGGGATNSAVTVDGESAGETTYESLAAGDTIDQRAKLAQTPIDSTHDILGSRLSILRVGR